MLALGTRVKVDPSAILDQSTEEIDNIQKDGSIGEVVYFHPIDEFPYEVRFTFIEENGDEWHDEWSFRESELIAL